MNESWGRLLFELWAGHLYVLSNLMWALMYRLVGVNPFPYFALMLSLHLLAVALLFALVRRLTSSGAFAGAAAATWGASPVNAGTLGWYCVYGQVLALVLGLVALCRAASASARGAVSPRTALVCAVCFVGSAMSFGTGLALAMCSPLILWLFVSPECRGRDTVWWWLVPPILIVPLYAACLWAYPPSETERALGMGIAHGLPSLVPAVTMDLALFGFGTSAVILGPASALVAGWARASMLVTLAFWLLVASGLWRGDSSRRRAIVALGLAALCQYTAIAIGRAPLFAKVGVSGADATRYHYGATAMLIAMAALAADAVVGRAGTHRRSTDIVAVLWLALSGGALVGHPIPIDRNAAARAEASALVGEVQALAKSAPSGRPVLVPNRPFVGAGPFLLASPDVFPGCAAAFTIYFPTNVVAGHRVFFVDPNGKTLAGARALPGSRIAQLLIGPDEIPALDAPEPP